MVDPRLTPARPDLAAKHLEGKVEAKRFVAGEEFENVSRTPHFPNRLGKTFALLTSE